MLQQLVQRLFVGDCLGEVCDPLIKPVTSMLVMAALMPDDAASRGVGGGGTGLGSCRNMITNTALPTLGI